MKSKLSNELKMTKAFGSVQEELYLALQRTAWSNQARMSEVLRSQNLTHPQYNVLRILRGAGDEGMSCGEISSRMVTHDSDVTRLVDKLVKAGWAMRERCEKDRRVVYCKITPVAQKILAKLDSQVNIVLAELYERLNDKECQRIIDLLEKARP